MNIYIDNENKCHAAAADGLRAFETETINEFFNGKCDAFIEGYRYIPYGETWKRSDGEIFKGEAIFPLKNPEIMAATQAQYESMLAEQEDMQTALEELGVSVNG